MTPEERRDLLKQWLEPRTVLALLSLLLAIGGAWFQLNRKVDAVEMRQAGIDGRLHLVESRAAQDHDVLIECRATLNQVRSMLEKQRGP